MSRCIIGVEHSTVFASAKRNDDILGSGVHVELDSEAAALLKAERNRRLHTVQIPALRLVGLTFFAGAAGLHNWLIVGTVSWSTVAWFAALVVAYGLLSWAVLKRLFGRTGRLNLGDLFLVVDIVFLVMTVYLSGGEQSWIFFVLLGRVADQAVGGFRRTVVFCHLCVLGFVLMLVWIAMVDGRSLPLAPTMAKILFFYLGGWYLAFCAIPVERRRRSVGAAVRTARALINRLSVTTAALEEARLHAEEASEAKSQFLTTMTHEVRTPLAAVIGMVQVLEGTSLDDTQRECVSHIGDGANATLRLVSDVLDLAALDEDRVDLERIQFKPATVVNEVTRSYRPAAEAKNIEFGAEVGDDVPAAVIGDPLRTRQILRLLVDNAIKFTVSGRVKVSCTVLGVVDDGLRLRWTVEDTGIGFDVDELPRLMETFVQGDGSLTRRHDGAGIGLALARRLVEAMGGALDATSTPGEGSTFWVDIPVKVGG